MSFKKSTTKDDIQEPEPGKVNTKALEKDLTEKGISYQQFSGAEETWRKRALKEDYAEMKLKHKWLYDQPIKE